MTTPGVAAPLPPTDRSPAWWRPALLAALAAALAVRFLDWPGVFRDGEIYLFGTDSYGHIRRIWRCGLLCRLVFEGSRNTPSVYSPEGDGVPTSPEIA